MTNWSEAVAALIEAGMSEYLLDHASRFPTVLLASAGEQGVLEDIFPSIGVTVDPAADLASTCVIDCRPPGSSPPRPGLIPLFSDAAAALICKAPDLRPNPVRGRRYYLLSTPRSGSTFLCDLLTSTGCLGRPTEHLKPWVADYLRLSGVPLGALLDGLHRYASTDGVFGTKIIIDDLFSFFPDYLDAFIAEFRAAAVFFLIRADKAAQAVSNLRASRLSIYHVDRAQAASGALGAVTLDVDMNDLFAMERWLLRQEADLIQILRDHRIALQTVSYEGVTQNHGLTAAVIDGMARSIGVGFPVEATWPSLVRISALVSPATQLDYAIFRSHTLLFSARSEPSLGELLLSGWGPLQHWGVVTGAGLAQLRIPGGQTWRFFEILLNVSPQSPDEIAIASVRRPLSRATGQSKQVRWFDRLSDDVRESGVIVIELEAGLISIEEVVFYTDLTPKLAVAVQCEAWAVAI